MHCPHLVFTLNGLSNSLSRQRWECFSTRNSYEQGTFTGIFWGFSLLPEAWPAWNDCEEEVVKTTDLLLASAKQLPPAQSAWVVGGRVGGGCPSHWFGVCKRKSELKQGPVLASSNTFGRVFCVQWHRPRGVRQVGEPAPLDSGRSASEAQGCRWGLGEGSGQSDREFFGISLWRVEFLMHETYKSAISFRPAHAGCARSFCRGPWPRCAQPRLGKAGLPRVRPSLGWRRWRVALAVRVL